MKQGVKVNLVFNTYIVQVLMVIITVKDKAQSHGFIQLNPDAVSALSESPSRFQSLRGSM